MILAKEFEGEMWVKASDLERKIKQAVEAEREACAKVCASFDLAPSKPTSYTIRKQVEAIRARGQE